MPSSQDHELSLNRRHVLCSGGAVAFSAIVATLLGPARPVRAENIVGSVPEIDGLAIRVVTDSYQFAVAPGRKTEDVEIQHFGWGISADKPPMNNAI